MAELKMTNAIVTILLTQITRANKEIDVSVSSIKHPSQSKDIKLYDYIKSIKEISVLLSEYKQLIEKDVKIFILPKILLKEWISTLEEFLKVPIPERRPLQHQSLA